MDPGRHRRLERRDSGDFRIRLLGRTQAARSGECQVACRENGQGFREIIRTRRQSKDGRKAADQKGDLPEVAAVSASERSKRLDRSLLLAVEALQTANTFEARDSLFKALQDRPGLRTFLHVEEGSVFDVAFSPDGKTIAAGYANVRGGGVVLWDLASASAWSDDPLPVKEGFVMGVAFSPDGKTIAAGYAGIFGSGVVLWDVAARKRLADDPLPVKEGFVMGVAFSPDGKTIAAGYRGGRDGGVVLWDVAARKRLSDDPLPVKGAMSVGWPSAPTERPSRLDTVASTAAAWCCGTWPAQAPVGRPLPVKGGCASGVAFSPDGKTIAAGYRGVASGGGVVLWDVAGRKRLAGDPLPVKEGSVKGVVFSPDGKTIAAGYAIGGGGGVVLWDVAGRAPAGRPHPHEGGLCQRRGLQPRWQDHRGWIRRASTSAAAGWCCGTFPAQSPGGRPPPREGGLCQWGGLQPRRQDHRGWILLRRSLQRRQRRRRGGAVGRGRARAPAGQSLPVKEGSVSGVAFSPDGKTIAAGFHGVGGGVVLWDAAGHKRCGTTPSP